jgi:hypothetical protein
MKIVLFQPPRQTSEIILSFFIFFYSGMDASHPEIFLFLYTVIVPAAPQETLRDAGIEPGTAALQSGVTLALSQLSHHIPN